MNQNEQAPNSGQAVGVDDVQAGKGCAQDTSTVAQCVESLIKAVQPKNKRKFLAWIWVGLMLQMLDGEIEL